MNPKFGAVAVFIICKIEDADYIITNKSLNSNLAKDIREDGVKIVCEELAFKFLCLAIYAA